jgi:hypothetical protein
MGNLHHNLKVIKVCMHEILEKLMPKHWKAYNHNHILSRIDPRSCTQCKETKPIQFVLSNFWKLGGGLFFIKFQDPFDFENLTNGFT